MKVLRNAKEQPWTLKIDCTGCTSELEIDANDLRKAPSSPKPGECGRAFICTCPVCKRDNWIDVTLIPRGVQTAVVQRDL